MSGYQHATAMTKRNAEDVLSQVNEILKKYRAELDQEELDEKVETDGRETETEDRETDEGGWDEENEGEEAPTTKSFIQYSP